MSDLAEMFAGPPCSAPRHQNRSQHCQKLRGTRGLAFDAS